MKLFHYKPPTDQPLHFQSNARTPWTRWWSTGARSGTRCSSGAKTNWSATGTSRSPTSVRRGTMDWPSAPSSTRTCPTACPSTASVRTTSARTSRSPSRQQKALEFRRPWWGAFVFFNYRFIDDDSFFAEHQRHVPGGASRLAVRDGLCDGYL